VLINAINTIKYLEIWQITINNITVSLFIHNPVLANNTKP